MTKQQTSQKIKNELQTFFQNKCFLFLDKTSYDTIENIYFSLNNNFFLLQPGSKDGEIKTCSFNIEDVPLNVILKIFEFGKKSNCETILQECSDYLLQHSFYGRNKESFLEKTSFPYLKQKCTEFEISQSIKNSTKKHKIKI